VTVELENHIFQRGRRCRDRGVVGFTTTYICYQWHYH